MVEWCCVKGCENNTSKVKNPLVRFFRFPAWKRTFGPQMEDITGRRRLAWVVAVRRKDITFNHIPPHMRVCSLHFHKGKPAYEMMETDPDWAPSLLLDSTVNQTESTWEQIRNDMMLEEAEREINWEQMDDEDGGLSDEEKGKPSYEMFETHPDWAPSLHLGHTEVKPSNQDRYDRLKQRNVNNADDPLTNPPTVKEEEVETVIVGGPQIKTPVVECESCEQKAADIMRLEEEIQTLKSDWMNECNLCSMRRSEITRLMDENRALKIELEKFKWEEPFLKGDNEKVKYYTGFPTLESLMTLLSIIAPFLPQNFRGVSCFQMFFMTLMRLRLNLPVQHIVYMFRRERATIGTAFNTTISALNTHCSHLLQWQSREEIRAGLPQKFTEDFEGRVGIYVECFELTLTALCKQPNLKYLISYTPTGRITFVSQGIEATVSEEDIIKKSGILGKLLLGDFIVSDQCFVFDKDGLKAVPKRSEVAKVFSKQKVYVKRMNKNMLNKYTILSTPVVPTMLYKFGEEMTLLDKIVRVCCALRSMSDSAETATPDSAETNVPETSETTKATMPEKNTPDTTETDMQE